MNYLLDTCLLSELYKTAPNAGVADWITQTDENRLFISTLSLGEIQKGIGKLDSGKRKTSIQEWLDRNLIIRFSGQMLSVDQDVALEWGLLCAAMEAKGKPAPVIDSLLGATAITHNLVIVTRNEKDFQKLPVKTLNPWAI